jgi:hypothetical protein
MNDKQFKKSMRALDLEMSVKNRENDFNRARSITVGTCFGGITEIMMRMNDGRTVWTTLQPVEVVELIHQLSANIGCHIHIQPRQDFSSWRNWKYTEDELKHYRGNQSLPGVGHPPHPNDMARHMEVGAKLPAPEQQPGLQPALMARSEKNEQTVATQKTVGRKRTKRAAATT